MRREALLRWLKELIARWEGEVVEFKRATSDFDTDAMGKYFSALANEANLRGFESAWLVFGVDDKRREVVGTNYRCHAERLQSAKAQMGQDTAPNVTFRNIYELTHPAGRVVMFEIPAAPRGMPVAWKGHYYGRAGESLTSLGMDKADAIRRQVPDADWSAQVVPEATCACLDKEAMARARQAFARRYDGRFGESEVMRWRAGTFLDRIKLAYGGRITRATLLLLGKDTAAAHLLEPNPAQLTWKLEGDTRAYEHFYPPFMLATTALYDKIRNVRLKILPDGTLLPIEMTQYDGAIVLEALHNCIAHQDYARKARVVVTEKSDRLVFENKGGFFEGKPEDYIGGEKTPKEYRNPCLANAMGVLGMIDSIGYGIHRMYDGQAKRFFPMPDYDVGDPDAVKFTLYGAVLDLSYSRLLINNTHLPMADVLALDKVQKRMPIDAETVKRLRRQGLVEGRSPNLRVSAKVAEATNTLGDYVKTRPQDDDYYCKLVMDYLRTARYGSRRDIDHLLFDKLGDVYNDDQKKNKIGYLLTKMRRNKMIDNHGSKRKPVWRLAE